MKAHASERELRGTPLGPRALGALLFLGVAGVFLPAVTHEFITYDDPTYVTENAHVKGGLTWEDFRWAFRSTEASNWHPLTWLSHMADYQVFGPHPWGHHLTSVLLHAANALLLFGALRRMTGATWRSLFVAALFGLHPLHVESVAWIAERKDVLSTTFWMLVLWFYAGRSELKKAHRPGASAHYWLTLLFFSLGLMCKPMLVTLPLVLVLMDLWPLDRWKGASASARWVLLAEKIPFFALSAASCAVTLFAQKSGGTVGSVEDFPVPVRLANALIAYCRYLGKCFIPVKLAVFYPFFAEQPALRTTLMAGGLLGAITLGAAALFRRRPYLLVGWLWFLGTLVPVIGVVQVGGQSMADRYTYVPLIGIFIMLAWGIADATSSWGNRTPILGSAAGAVLIALTAMTCRQLGFWRDGARLFRHTLDVTENNWVAHANLYATLAKSSDPAANAELQETIHILAAFAKTYDQKGQELDRLAGRSLDAIKDYETAIRIMPDLAGPHNVLGAALAKIPGRLPEAIAEFREAARLQPNFADAHYNLGIALAGTPGGQAEAITEFKAVTELSPNNFQAHYNLAYLLSLNPGRESEAAGEYQVAIQLMPDAYQAHFNLGLILSGIPGRSAEAMGQFLIALREKPDLEQAREMIERLRATSQ